MNGEGDLLRRLNELTVKGSASSRFIVAERDGTVLGVLQFADQPDCLKMSGRQMLSSTSAALAPGWMTVTSTLSSRSWGMPSRRRPSTARLPATMKSSISRLPAVG